MTGTFWNPIVTNRTSDIRDQNREPTAVQVMMGTNEPGSVNRVSLSNPVRGDTFNLVSSGQNRIFNTGMGTSNILRGRRGNLGVAASVRGLNPGVYRFYLTAFRGDQLSNVSRIYDVFWAHSGGPLLDFSAANTTTIFNTNRTSWTENNNFVTGQFTVTSADDHLNVLVLSGDSMGVMNSLAIVDIPEPAAFAGALGFLALAALAVRRPRRERPCDIRARS